MLLNYHLQYFFLKEEQEENIQLILVTLVVLNEDKSIDSKEEQRVNICIILVTLVVLNEDKSIDYKEEQPRNIKKVDVNNLLNLNVTCIFSILLLSYI